MFNLIRALAILSRHLSIAVLEIIDDGRPNMDDPLDDAYDERLDEVDEPVQTWTFGHFKSDRPDGDSDSCPLASTQSYERASDDHPGTTGGFRS